MKLQLTSLEWVCPSIMLGSLVRALSTRWLNISDDQRTSHKCSDGTGTVPSLNYDAVGNPSYSLRGIRLGYQLNPIRGASCTAFAEYLELDLINGQIVLEKQDRFVRL